MTIEELYAIYPDGIVAQTKASNDFLSLFVEGKYFILKKEALNKAEILLLKKYFSPKEFQIDQHKHPWYRFLFQHQPLALEGSFRIFQFHIQKPKEFLQKEWENSINDIFPHAVDFFFFNENDGVLIERYQKNYYSLDDIQGIFLTLDADFDSSTTVFIGNFFASKDSIAALFLEEQAIFNDERGYTKSKSAFALTDVALHYFTKETMKQSLIVANFEQQLALDTEIQKIILALWHNQGNISSTAKDLFMHRNTLQYRMDKFFEQTGLSLKKMNDLVFCYLLISK